MPDLPGVISMTSYQHGFNATQPKEDGSDWNNRWPSFDMLRVRDAVNYDRMVTFSMVVVGMLYNGGTPVSRFGRVIDMTTLHHALYPDAPMIYPGRFLQYRTDLVKPSGGSTEEICYHALGMADVPIKVVGVILQKLS